MVVNDSDVLSGILPFRVILNVCFMINITNTIVNHSGWVYVRYINNVHNLNIKQWYSRTAGMPFNTEWISTEHFFVRLTPTVLC